MRGMDDASASSSPSSLLSSSVSSSKDLHSDDDDHHGHPTVPASINDVVPRLADATPSPGNEEDLNALAGGDDVSCRGGTTIAPEIATAVKHGHHKSLTVVVGGDGVSPRVAEESDNDEAFFSTLSGLLSTPTLLDLDTSRGLCLPEEEKDHHHHRSPPPPLFSSSSSNNNYKQEESKDLPFILIHTSKLRQEEDSLVPPLPPSSSSSSLEDLFRFDPFSSFSIFDENPSSLTSQAATMAAGGAINSFWEYPPCSSSSPFLVFPPEEDDSGREINRIDINTSLPITTTTTTITTTNTDAITVTTTPLMQQNSLDIEASQSFMYPPPPPPPCYSFPEYSSHYNLPNDSYNAHEYPCSIAPPSHPLMLMGEYDWSMPMQADNTFGLAPPTGPQYSHNHHHHHHHIHPLPGILQEFGNNSQYHNISSSNSSSSSSSSSSRHRQIHGESQCQNCQNLRCITHSNGVQDTKLEIHGCNKGQSYHAVLQTCFCIDDGFPSSLEQQMVEFPVGNAEYVKQFLLQYSLLRQKEGFVLTHDSLQLPSFDHQGGGGCGMSMIHSDPFIGTSCMLNKPTGSFYPSTTEPGQNKMNNNYNNNSQMTDAQVVPLKPPKSNAAAQREKTGKMKMTDLAQFFHLPINAAAKELGICPTVLKKICRRNGMRRWPHRKIKSIERIIATLEQTIAEGSGGQGDESIRMEISMLQNERAQLCAGLLGEAT